MKIETLITKKPIGGTLRLDLFPVSEFFLTQPGGTVYRKMLEDGDGRTLVLNTDNLELERFDSSRKVYTTIVTKIRLEMTVAEV